VTKTCESFADGFARIGRTLDRQEHSVLGGLEIAEVHGMPKFGGGLGAVRTGIALFCATKAVPCTVCNLRRVA